MNWRGSYASEHRKQLMLRSFRTSSTSADQPGRMNEIGHYADPHPPRPKGPASGQIAHVPGLACGVRPHCPDAAGRPDIRLSTARRPGRPTHGRGRRLGWSQSARVRTACLPDLPILGRSHWSLEEASVAVQWRSRAGSVSATCRATASGLGRAYRSSDRMEAMAGAGEQHRRVRAVPRSVGERGVARSAGQGPGSGPLPLGHGRSGTPARGRDRRAGAAGGSRRRSARTPSPSTRRSRARRHACWAGKVLDVEGEDLVGAGARLIQESPQVRSRRWRSPRYHRPSTKRRRSRSAGAPYRTQSASDSGPLFAVH
jgi:hypothetical protein